MKASLLSRIIKWCGDIFDTISNFISRNFGSNVGLMVFALILSTIIVNIISERTGVEKEFTVPVKIVMNTKDTALSSYTPNEIKVSLKGTLEDLNVIDSSLLMAEIVVREDYDTGEHVIKKIHSSNIRNHGKLKVDDIRPNKIEIVFDKEARFHIPVALPKLEGTPLQGGAATVRFVSGSEVIVTGSELKLARLVDGGLGFATAPINVTDRLSSFEREVELIVPPDLEVKSIEPKTLKVAIDIQLPEVETKEDSSVDELELEKDNDKPESPTASDLPELAKEEEKLTEQAVSPTPAEATPDALTK